MLRLWSLVHHIDFHDFVRGDKFVVKSPAAIVRRAEFFENRVAVLVDAVLDRARHHLSHHRQTMQPLFGPYDFTLVVSFTFRYARRPESPTRDSREAGFFNSLTPRQAVPPLSPFQEFPYQRTEC